MTIGINPTKEKLYESLLLTRERVIELNEIMKAAADQDHHASAIKILVEGTNNINEYSWLIFQYGVLWANYRQGTGHWGLIISDFKAYAYRAIDEMTASLKLSNPTRP